MPDKNRDFIHVGQTVALNNSDFPELTKREFAILDRVVNGQSAKDTAQELAISYRTVEIHRMHIASKIHARNIADIVRIAVMRTMSAKPVGDTNG